MIPILPFSVLTSICLALLVSCENNFSKNESVSTGRMSKKVNINIHTETDKKSIKSQSTNNVTTIANKSIRKYTEKEILNLIIGNYTPDEGCCNCKFELSFEEKSEKLKYYIRTNERKISGIAKIKIDENGFVYVLFPIEWDDYQGDMTLDTYEPYTGIKPQVTDTNFDPKLKNLDFQNYGNAMNNYIIFSECDNKRILLSKK